MLKKSNFWVFVMNPMILTSLKVFLLHHYKTVKQSDCVIMCNGEFIGMQVLTGK